MVVDPLSLVTTGASWIFTAPVPGLYHIDAHYQGNAAVTMGLFKNGSLLHNVMDVVTNTHCNGVATVSMATADVIHLLGGGSSTATTGVNTTFIQIARVK